MEGRMISRLRRYLASKELVALRVELEEEFALRSQVIFQTAYCQGQLYGQQAMIDQLNGIVAERHELCPDPTEEDIERLRWLH